MRFACTSMGMSHAILRPLPPALLLLGTASARVPAFPGSEGFAAHSNGGRGGDTYQVSNLNTKGPGSFLDAISTPQPEGRTIVFTTSGIIPIHKARLSASNITIAGQTAPGDGVCLSGSSLTISGADVVIRRFRHGAKGNGGDCINPDGGAKNLIIDHCDVMFSADENLSSFRTAPPTMTFQWSTNAWGIHGHSCGGLWLIDHATARHTLWANNKPRLVYSSVWGHRPGRRNFIFMFDGHHPSKPINFCRFFDIPASGRTSTPPPHWREKHFTTRRNGRNTPNQPLSQTPYRCFPEKTD